MDYGESSESTFGVTDADANEGYAGVALSVIEGIETGEPVHTALNVSNEGAIACMRPDDVVEVSCLVDGEGVHPRAIGAIPELQELLMRTVKLYERLAVRAILDRSRAAYGTDGRGSSADYAPNALWLLQHGADPSTSVARRHTGDSKWFTCSPPLPAASARASSDHLHGCSNYAASTAVFYASREIRYF